MSELSEREQLEQAIVHLESQRAALGDAAVNAAQAGLHEKLAALEETGSAGGGERKLVTILFADLAGFTAMSEKMDPEEVRAIANACFTTLEPIIEKYGGTIDKFIGDEIMALFGAPLAHENDPERALRAALEMRQALERLNENRDLDLGLHFGVNTGLVFAGEVGAQKSRDYSVVGDAVNLAARLQDASGRDEIFVGLSTFRAAAPLFLFEELAPMTLKGIAAPVTIYRLLDLKASPSRTRGLEAVGISSPLVGRLEEMRLINDRLARLKDGEGSIITVTGEAGVGKSRLLAEIRKENASSAQEGDLTWLEGKTSTHGQTISYLPFQEIIATFAGIAEGDDEATALSKLDASVNNLFSAGAGEILPYIATLLALEPEDDTLDEGVATDSEVVQRRVFLAVRRLFERLATEKPLVLEFEDLHWLDDSSARLLEHILPLVERVPVAIIGVSRPAEVEGITPLWQLAAEPYPGRSITLRLEPLTEAEGRRLVTNLLAIRDLPPELQEAIVHRSEGNSLYIEEIVRTLIDSDVIVHDPQSGEWRTRSQIRSFTLPETIQGVIMARVDRLDEGLKAVIGAAAVIGRSFLFPVLAAVVDMGREQLRQRLDELQEAAFVRRRQNTVEAEYTFHHVLVQEAVYENMLRQTRRDMHGRVGDTIEALYADRLDEFYGILAYHFARAEQWPKAQHYLLQAADQEGRMAADAEALAHYRQALEANARMVGETWSPLQRAQLSRKMGEAFFRRGESAKAYEYLNQALTILSRPLPDPSGARRRALAGQVGWQVSFRLGPGRWLSRSAHIDPEEIIEIGRIYERLMGITLMLDPELSALVLLTSLNFAERYQYVPGMIVGYAMLGVFGDLAGQRKLTDFYGRKALRLTDDTSEPGGTSVALTAWALHQNITGDMEEVIKYAQQAVDVQQDRPLWNILGADFTTLCFADAYVHLGDFAAALSYGEKLRRTGEDSGDKSAWSLGLSRRGYALQGLGRIDEAVESEIQAMEIALSRPDYQTYVDSGGALGACYLRQGKLEEALEIFETCEQVSLEHGIDRSPITTRYKNGRLEAWLMLAERSEGAERAGWLARAEAEKDAVLKHGQKNYVPGLPETMMLRGTLAWLLGDESGAQEWWEGSRAMAEEMKLKFDLARTLLETGRRLDDRGSLQRAIALFEKTGSQWELQEARRIVAESV